MGNEKTTAPTKPETAKKEKAAPGSSIAAQARQLVVAVKLELTEGLAKLSEDFDEALKLTDVLTEGTAEWLTNLAGEIGNSAARGLPLAQRIQNVENEITEHWQSMPIVNGKAARSPEWEEKAKALMTKKDNLQRAIKRTTTDNGGTDAEATSNKTAEAATK